MTIFIYLLRKMAAAHTYAVYAKNMHKMQTQKTTNTRNNVRRKETKTIKDNKILQWTQRN